MWCKVSKATKMLSEIALSDWNALCDSEIMWQKFLNLFATTLETSLYNIFHKEMGRYSETLVGLLTLGISVINGRWN